MDSCDALIKFSRPDSELFGFEFEVTSADLKLCNRKEDLRVPVKLLKQAVGEASRTLDV